MRAIRGLQGGLLLSVAGLVAGCELIVGVGTPRLREQDAGSGGEGGTGGTGGTTTTTSSSSSSSSTSTSSGTGGSEPTCTDGAKNGVETDKDCGGGECPACAIGKGCVVGTDCESVACGPSHVCVPPACNDTVQNGDETYIDCGGLSCPGCPIGKSCVGNGDCKSGNCVSGFCDPPSCSGGGAGKADCGKLQDDNCCASLSVPGGSYYRSYDGISLGYTSQAFPATVSGFRLDKFEITVGRFREFVNAWVSGWRPEPGAGKHSYLNAGNGLAATDAGFEGGWNATWSASFPNTAAAWSDSSHLACGQYPTWTASPTATGEHKPINCLGWAEAYAFCIWDGGFLPSEAEWNFAAAGGNEQRVYPWSVPANSTTIDCTYADYKSCGGNAPVSAGFHSPNGDGKWGHSDLGGSVFEWALDQSRSLTSTCADCVEIGSSTSRAVRGGAFNDFPSHLLASFRVGNPPDARNNYTGARCARNP